MAIKAILFDHDGTLVNSEITHYNMWQVILKSYGIVLTREEYVQHYAGIPTTSNSMRMVSDYSSLVVPPSTLAKEKNAATSAFLSRESFPLMVGAKECINEFKDQGFKMAVVTGAGGEGVRVTINSHNLHGYFSTVVSGDDVDRSKPAPDCYLLAAKRLGVNLSECLAIEDTESGVAAAVAANIPCVAVSSSMSKNHDFSKAIKSFSNLNEARKWIIANYSGHNRY